VNFIILQRLEAHVFVRIAALRRCGGMGCPRTGFGIRPGGIAKGIGNRCGKTTKLLPNSQVPGRVSTAGQRSPCLGHQLGAGYLMAACGVLCPRHANLPLGIVRLVIGAAEVDDLGVDTPEGDQRGRGVVQGPPVSGG
jgi:hypothetical protein